MAIGIDISDWQGGNDEWKFVTPRLGMSHCYGWGYEEHRPHFYFPTPMKVYFNGKYTIVEWSDGVKTKAGLHAEEFDEEKGIAMAIARRFLGRGQFERLLESADDQR